MTIASELTKLNTNLTNSYNAISGKGGTLPRAHNFDNLVSAISSIPSGGGISIPREVKNGVYQLPTEKFTFSLPNNVTDVGSDALYYAFHNCSVLTSVDLSSLTTLSGSKGLYGAFYGCTALTNVNLSSLRTVSGSEGLRYTFYNCTALTNVNLSSLTTVSGSNGLYYTFYKCSALTSVDLSSLRTVSGSYGLQNAFYGCTALTNVNLSSLTTVRYYGLGHAFDNCTMLANVDFSSLSTVSDSGCFSYAFYDCTGLTNVYFRSLKTSSFGSYKNQFDRMMINTGTSKTHTIHFPSNLQSTISGLTGYPLFGGTSGYVKLAFDLPTTS